MDDLKGKVRERRTIKKKKDKEQKLKSKKIKKEKFKKENADNFSIISHLNENNFQIEKAGELYQYGQTKIFKKFLITETIIYDLNIIKQNAYSNLESCSEISELNYISDKNELMKNKIKSYVIESFNNEENEIIANNKIKYNDSEIKICLNEININLEKNKKRKIDILTNGIPIDELKLNKKIKFKNISNLEKVKQIINNIKKGNILNKILKDKNIPKDYYLCTNCYECYNNNVSNNHNEHFNLNINDFKDIEDELDYDEKLQNLYNILKKGQNKILKNSNNNIIKYFKQLLFTLYEIIINDNSCEELYVSIININDNYYKEKKIGTFSDNYNYLFLFFCQIISMLAYLKAQDISINENKSVDETGWSLDELSNENVLNKNDFDKYSDEDKKKYFFDLGFSFKSKNNKNISIIDLYNKAKEQNITINDYKNFFNKEFNIQNE